MNRIMVCCATCGGENVVRDAAALWNPVGQVWVLGDVYDEAYCDDCECDVAIVERTLVGPCTAVSVIARRQFDDYRPSA